MLYIIIRIPFYWFVGSIAKERSSIAQTFYSYRWQVMEFHTNTSFTTIYFNNVVKTISKCIVWTSNASYDVQTDPKQRSFVHEDNCCKRHTTWSPMLYICSYQTVICCWDVFLLHSRGHQNWSACFMGTCTGHDIPKWPLMKVARAYMCNVAAACEN